MQLEILKQPVKQAQGKVQNEKYQSIIREDPAAETTVRQTLNFFQCHSRLSGILLTKLRAFREDRSKELLQ